MLEAAHGCRRNLNLEGLHAMDLRTLKEDGTPWNFDNADDRRLAKEMVLRLQPTWLIGSPPCTAFSKLNINLNFPKMDPAEVAARIAQGRRHLRFVLSLYKIQLDGGGASFHPRAPRGGSKLA